MSIVFTWLWSWLRDLTLRMLRGWSRWPLAPPAARHTVKVEGRETQIEIGPLYRHNAENWSTLGCVFIPKAISAPAIRAAEALCGPFANSRSWPFVAAADSLLRVAEKIASHHFAESFVRADDYVWSAAEQRCREEIGCAVAAYQYCFRDTVKGLGALEAVHADNVDAADALCDFASLVLNPDASMALGATAEQPRDALLLDVGHGARTVSGGVNVWFLLEDSDESSPLAFVDLSHHLQHFPERASGRLATPAEPAEAAVYTCHGSGGSILGGTRNLKLDALPLSTFRAHEGMRPGDAYVFATWGPKAAFHAGATRTPLPKGARRRSVEIRVALVSARRELS